MSNNLKSIEENLSTAKKNREACVTGGAFNAALAAFQFLEAEVVIGILPDAKQASGYSEIGLKGRDLLGRLVERRKPAELVMGYILVQDREELQELAAEFEHQVEHFERQKRIENLRVDKHRLLQKRDAPMPADELPFDPRFWSHASGNARLALEAPSIASFLEDIFDDYHVVWAIIPDRSPNAEGPYTAVMMQGWGFYERQYQIDGEMLGLTAFHCASKDEARRIAEAFSKDGFAPDYVSRNARIASAMFPDGLD